ncbi:MAG: hypothetical protein HY853_06440 [Burkholderiales bacterium]|nr:hypothetical protein [Burkholderiales bacterium]
MKACRASILYFADPAQAVLETEGLLPGCEGDFVVLNPQATPLLARKTGASS